MSIPPFNFEFNGLTSAAFLEQYLDLLKIWHVTFSIKNEIITARVERRNGTVYASSEYLPLDLSKTVYIESRENGHILAFQPLYNNFEISDCLVSVSWDLSRCFNNGSYSFSMVFSSMTVEDLEKSDYDLDLLLPISLILRLIYRCFKAACVPTDTRALFPSQNEIWIAQNIAPDSSIYNIAQFTEIHGSVDLILFQVALRQVITEAESVRLQFIKNSKGVQQFVGSPDQTMILIDLCLDVAPQVTAEAWMKTDYEKSVDILGEPLFCYVLFKVAPTRFLWYQRYHRIIMDGEGCLLIVQRLAQVYNALMKGIIIDDSPFESLSILFEKDHYYRDSAQFTRDHEYWLGQCKSSFEPVTLAVRPPLEMSHRLRQTSYFSIPLDSINSTDSKYLKSSIVASMAVYTYRWTGIQDVVLGLSMSSYKDQNHHLPGIANVLPIRLAIQPNMSLRSVTTQATQEIECGSQHQQYSGAELRRELGHERNQLLFGITINFIPFDKNLSFGECSMINHNLVNGPVEDLMITIYTSSDDNMLQIDFDANPELYTTDELIAHQSRFLKVLHSLITNSTQTTEEIDLLDALERQQLLVEWNATECIYPTHMCIHQLFEEQVERTPHATAIVYSDQILSYTELNTRANSLAYQLLELGVQPDARVAICVGRSPAMMVGLLAILKAGGAYVPLDPAYPSERLAHTIADSAPTIVLADATGRLALGEATLASLTVLDPNIRMKFSISNPQIHKLNSRHLAYVIYTSGSTGTPKGVMMEHRGVVNLVQSQIANFGIRQSSRVLQFASISFDVSVEEIFTTLSCGASLYLPPNAARHDRNDLWEYLERYSITHVSIAPVLLQDGDNLSKLKYEPPQLCHQCLRPNGNNCLRHHMALSPFFQ
ncbi:hypothetical protein K7432_013023 [Basidiobolus ranarum]|uniref:Uncharacterized protein n=1 Tax=Basidiobolus ranarum TaxID=34480 RepID=A0ABR2VRD5_9FUNG